MSPTVELSEDMIDRLDRLRAEGETREELIGELLNHYETEGRFLWEGYSGEP